MHKAIERLTDFMLRHELLAEKDRAWCVYALERRVLTGGNFLVLWVLGACLAGAIASLSFLAVVLWLRKRTGGYHASTPFRCLLVSSAVTCLALGIILPYLQAFVCCAMVAGSVVCVWLLAPSNHKKLHFSTAELAANRTYARRRLFAVVTLFVVLLLLGQTVAAASLSLGLAMVACSLVAAKIAKQEEIVA